MKEIWKTIPEFKEFYEVSNHGNYRAIKPRQGNNRTITILKPKLQWDGYLMFRLNKNKKQYLRNAHRTVAFAFIPNPDNKEQVNHKDLNKQNNHVSNLEWVTPKENIQHAIKSGAMVGNIHGGGDVMDKLLKHGYDVIPGMTRTREGKNEYMRAYNHERLRGNI